MKKILLSLFVCFVGFISFSSADLITGDYSFIGGDIFSLNSGDCFFISDGDSLNTDVDVLNEYNEYIYRNIPNGSLVCVNTPAYIDTDGSTMTYISLFSGLFNNSVVDTNFCVENDLCPVPDNFSQLFINNLEFQSHPIINIDIPDYITWDYTGTDSGFNLYVGSGYDVDYINSIIDINSYRPDSTDFTNIFVSGLTLILPYIIFVLFLVFMRKLIKRIFK